MGPGEGIWMAHAYRNHVDERGLARVLQADERELHLLLEEKAAFAHAGWRLRREARVLRCAAARTCECTRGPNRPSSGTTLQSFASPLLSPIRISAREDRHQALASQASSCVPTTAAHVPITSKPHQIHRYAHRYTLLLRPPLRSPLHPLLRPPSRPPLHPTLRPPLHAAVKLARRQDGQGE